MKYLFIAMFVVSPQLAFAKNTKPVNEYTCYGIDHKIDKIKERQRGGYKAKEGERLRNDLRELKELKSECKKKKIPTE